MNKTTIAFTLLSTSFSLPAFAQVSATRSLQSSEPVVESLLLNSSLLKSLEVGSVGEATPADEGWSFEVLPYVWGSGITGDVGIGPVESEVDVSFEDLVENLDMGAMLGLEASPANSDWSLLFDFMYFDIGDDITGVDVDVSELMMELDVAYRPEGWDEMELLAGLRYVDIDAEVVVGPLSPSLSESWVDPVVGVRGLTPISEDWSLRWRGDVGGFGVGSDLSYQLSALFQCPIGDSTQFGIGWRHLAVDYDDDGFAYDTETSGLIMGLSIAF